MRLDFASLLTDANVRAFLLVIRRGESSLGPEAYSMRYPGKRFEDLSRHPRIFEPLPDGRQSSAAGAYQFTATTWDEIRAKYELPDSMAQGNQDRMAVALLDHIGALNLVLVGDFYGATRIAGKRWASLPDAVLEDGGSNIS